MKFILLILIAISLIHCSADDESNIDNSNKIYFPPISSEVWETTTPTALDWDENRLSDLYDFLSSNNTRAFIILKDGKIVVEKYWGNNILNTSEFTQNTSWYWASAGKSLTSFLIGRAQEKGLLNIDNKTSDYLGENWSNLSSEKEDLITVKHHLCMTTGLDYTVSNPDCTTPDCLEYKMDAGTQWYYHNAPYTLLEEVITNTSGISYNQFTQNELGETIGISVTWIKSGDNNIYWSKPRDAARFGLLILNKGKWGDQQIMTDADYFDAMTTTSQNLNPSYGYLWWLNGKSSIVLPGSTFSYSTSLASNAPSDMIAAMGKNGQFIDVVPSKNIVVIRMGQTPDNSLVPVQFHNDMWEKILNVIQP